MASVGPPGVLTVSSLLRRLRVLVEDAIGTVVVEGEIADLHRPGSGHCYFTLKDEHARISCVMFSKALRVLGDATQPADGRHVRVTAEFSLYEPRGQIQLVVRRLEMGGEGALLQRFEALKRKLREEGLFDASRKRPLPLLSRHIGVVTSPTGAVIRDILTILERRFYNVHVLLAPVRVQGEGAAQSIAAAIAHLNSRGDLDVLIVGRGGGSLEDLQPFNEECVARAIAASALPVISAVGHETDTTISDWVADVRAPTPSAAAELVVGRKLEFQERLTQTQGRMGRVVTDALAHGRHRLRACRLHHVFQRPGFVLERHRQHLDAMEMRMRERLNARVAALRQRLSAASGIVRPHRMFPLESARSKIETLAQRMRQSGDAVLERSRRRLAGLKRPLEALDPNRVLARGYSLTFDAAGHSVQSAEDLKAGDVVQTRLARGEFRSRVFLDAHDGEIPASD